MALELLVNLKIILKIFFLIFKIFAFLILPNLNYYRNYSNVLNNF